MAASLSCVTILFTSVLHAKLRTGDLVLAAIDGTPCLRGLTVRGETQLLGDREFGEYAFPLGKVERVVTVPRLRV